MADESSRMPRVVETDGVSLQGDMSVPTGARGMVLFVHGSGSSHLSPRNRFVADVLGDAGLGTLLFDLLTPEEEEAERHTRHLRFDIPLLTRRVGGATYWLRRQPEAGKLKLGYFAASTGAAAALGAALRHPTSVQAIVSRGGRPDLVARDALPHVRTPTRLIVGGLDHLVIELNRNAYQQLGGPKDLAIVPGASHLFEEGTSLEQVAELAADWFRRYLE